MLSVVHKECSQFNGWRDKHTKTYGKLSYQILLSNPFSTNIILQSCFFSFFLDQTIYFQTFLDKEFVHQISQKGWAKARTFSSWTLHNSVLFRFAAIVVSLNIVFSWSKTMFIWELIRKLDILTVTIFGILNTFLNNIWPTLGKVWL